MDPPECFPRAKSKLSRREFRFYLLQFAQILIYSYFLMIIIVHEDQKVNKSVIKVIKSENLFLNKFRYESINQSPTSFCKLIKLDRAASKKCFDDSHNAVENALHLLDYSAANCVVCLQKT